MKVILERLIFTHRKAILLLFVLFTAFMFWQAAQLRVDAGFKKQLPLKHEYMQTFLKYEKEFGGANRLLVALIARDGNMFTPEFFDSLEKMTNDVFFIPGVNRSSVRSIFTPNVRFVEIVEDGFAGGNVIPSNFRPTPEMFEQVKGNIIKSGTVGRLVAEDFSGAMVWADLLEINPVTGEKIDYQQVARQLEEIRTRYENEHHSVHIIGFAKIVGDIADGARSVILYFFVATLITAVLLYLYSRSLWLTLWPLLVSAVAVVWQLGVLRLLGYGIDPMNMLTPFLVFAIAVSHGVQMINAWTTAVARADGEDASLQASRQAFSTLLVPGTIALLSDTIGFLTLLLIQIRIIQEMAITASLGVAMIILTNLVLLPVLLSFGRSDRLEAIRRRQRRTLEKPSPVWRLLSGFSRPLAGGMALLVAAGLFAAGQWKAQEMEIGDSQTGVPELRPDSRYNTDARLISSRFALGVDLMTVIAETEPNACTENYEVMETIDRFAWHIQNVPGVQKVITLPRLAKIINAGWNEGNIKWRVLSRNHYVMRQALANVETDTGLLNADCSAIPVLIFTTDHRAETVARVVNAVKVFQKGLQDSAVQLRLDKPELNSLDPERQPITADQVNFRLATGNVGVMAATNEDVKAAQMPMLMYVYGAIIALCLVTFRSLAATLCIVLPLMLVSVLAYALMAIMGVGLKVNTLPVVALGVGIGVDYGIYIYSRLKEYLDAGMPLTEAYYHALQTTGKPVIFTGITLAVGVGTWLFSELKFQADMGLLLAFMFLVNMIGAIVLLPALVRWLMRPADPA